MRLTLRTLLAYLDEILEEEDAQELQQKIKESEVASKLAHRIRHVIGQLRGDAPAPTADGLGKDANSVAEYLDNTLRAEKIAEFERICLESDEHLAEVAACHQILTLVLGEPAEISPELKERICRLSADLQAQDQTDTETAESPAAEAAPASTTPVGVSADTGPSPPSPPVQRPADDDEHWTEAPDYLKRPRSSRWKPLGIAAVAAFCLVVAGLRGIAPLDRSHPLARWLGIGTDQVAQQNTAADTSTDSPPTSDSPAEPTSTPPASDSDPTEPDRPPEELADDEATNPQESIPPAEPPSQDSLPPPTNDGVTPGPADDRPQAATDASEPTTDQADPLGGAGSPQPESDDQPPTPETPIPLDSDPGRSDASMSESDNNTEPTPGAEPPEPSGLVNPLAGRGPSGDEVSTPVPALPNSPEAPDPDGVTPDPTVNGATGPDSPPPEPRSLEAGRYLSDDQLLLRFDETSQLWQRLPSRSPLQAGDQLLSLPTYRPQVMLPTGMQLTLIGAGRAVMESPPDEETPQVRLEFARVTVVTFARAGTKIGLTWSNRIATASFADMDTTLAIEVTRQHVPGTDPEQQGAHVVLRVYPTSGSIEWQSEDTPAFQVPAGQRLTIVDDGPARLDEVEQIPDWVDGRDARPTDPIAARGLEPKVTIDRSAALSLNEQADSRRVEVRSLAACSLAYLGEFDPLLLALNDGQLKSYWSDQYRVLTECMALDQGVAARIREALEQRHEADAEQLFRMLWGYSSQQLTDGGAELLVDALDHDSSDFRIAAIENLKTITGKPSLYLPYFTAAQRRSSVFKWREKLNKGQIKYAALPEIVRLLETEADSSTP